MQLYLVLQPPPPTPTPTPTPMRPRGCTCWAWPWAAGGGRQPEASPPRSRSGGGGRRACCGKRTRSTKLFSKCTPPKEPDTCLCNVLLQWNPDSRKTGPFFFLNGGILSPASTFLPGSPWRPRPWPCPPPRPPSRTPPTPPGQPRPGKKEKKWDRLRARQCEVMNMVLHSWYSVMESRGK